MSRVEEMISRFGKRKEVPVDLPTKKKSKVAPQSKKLEIRRQLPQTVCELMFSALKKLNFRL